MLYLQANGKPARRSSAPSILVTSDDIEEAQESCMGHIGPTVCRVGIVDPDTNRKCWFIVEAKITRTLGRKPFLRVVEVRAGQDIKSESKKGQWKPDTGEIARITEAIEHGEAVDEFLAPE